MKKLYKDLFLQFKQNIKFEIKKIQIPFLSLGFGFYNLDFISFSLR